jgi:protein-S-isoprenylcysteine O-methyltransferase Ste14
VTAAAGVLWLCWLLLWLAAAPGVKRARWREPLWSRVVHGVPLVIAMRLLFWPTRPRGLLDLRFVPPDPAIARAGLLLVILGLGFSLWARAFLGRNWSGTVTIKEGHTLVSGGPYRWVRHPIYTGLLLAVLGTALVCGEWRGLAALALAFAGFLYKSRLEERRLQQEFPEYEAYRRVTPALIPFLL